jgi:GMP synthase-like glutamine amidotransferase
LAQLIAHAFGQRVYRFGGLEVDYPMVLLTAAGWTDPLFQGLAPEQRIMQMHEDSFDLTQESVLLMLNETRHSGLVHRSMGSKRAPRSGAEGRPEFST